MIKIPAKPNTVRYDFWLDLKTKNVIMEIVALKARRVTNKSGFDYLGSISPVGTGELGLLQDDKKSKLIVQFTSGV